MTIGEIGRSAEITLGGVESPSTEDSLIGRIGRIAMDVFEYVKQKVVLYWNAIVSWSQSRWTATTFAFFRALDYIHPSLSANIERGYLYLKSFYDHSASEAREAHLVKENDQLLKDRNELRMLLQQTALERNRSDEENINLKTKNELLKASLETTQRECSSLNEQREYLQKTLDNERRNTQLIEVQLESVRKQRDIYEKQEISKIDRLTQTRSETVVPILVPTAGLEGTSLESLSFEQTVDRYLTADEKARFSNAIQLLSNVSH